MRSNDFPRWPMATLLGVILFGGLFIMSMADQPTYKDLQSQLTQRTAELEAANTLLYKKNCALGRAETSINDLQAELERVRDQYADLSKLIKALPKVEGAVVVSDGYVKDSTRCHALFGADEDAALYAALLQHRQGMEG